MYAFNAHGIEILVHHVYLNHANRFEIETMARAALDDTDRMNIRVKPEVKARLLRAAALRHIDLTSFVTQTALREAEAVIAEADSINASERDFVRILELLDNPPKPNARLRAAAEALPKTL